MMAGVQPAMTCDICSVYQAQEAQGGGTSGFFGGVAEQYTEFDTFMSDGHSAPNPDGTFIHSLSSQLFAGYNFNQRVGVQFNLPVIWREYGSAGAHSRVFGIGDASLTGSVRLYQKFTDNFNFTWTALGGIKFPTGDSALLVLDDADLPAGIGGHDLAPGSGSVDGIVGTGFSTRWKKIFFTGQMQYSIRTEGDFGHHYANDWTWSGGPGAYLALKDNYTVALQANISGESKGKDTFGGVPDNDSAATMVYAGPQMNFTWSEKFSASLGADIPVSYDNSGEQILPGYRVHGAVTMRF